MSLIGNNSNINICNIHRYFFSELKCYPTLAGGVTITANSSSWVLGNFAIIVPANTITQQFSITNISAVQSTADVYELVFYSGADGSEVEIARIRATTYSIYNHIPVITPIIDANSQIKAKLASQAGASHQLTISIGYVII